MSYDIYLRDDAGNTVKIDPADQPRGGTYALGSTSEAWLNITYNYAPHFYRTMGEKGIRTIYGMTAEESIPLLEQAIASLGDDVDPDYWKPTEGNAKATLVGLLGMARLRPHAVWSGD